MTTVQRRVQEIAWNLDHIGCTYGLGQGHDRSTWTAIIYFADGTTASLPRTTDCSGAVICAYENAMPGCTGGAGDTGDIKSCFLSTGLWEWHPAGDGYVAQVSDVYLYSKAIHGSGHTALCYTTDPNQIFELVPTRARITPYYDFNGCWDGILHYVGPNSADTGSGTGAGTGTGTGGSTSSNQIEEDGYWGPATTSAMQRHYGLVVDGEVWHQWASNIAANPNLLTSSWKCDTTQLGSPMVRAMQADLGVTADGIMGPQTIRAIYALFGGVYGSSNTISGAAVWQIQHQLNTGIWPYHL